MMQNFGFVIDFTCDKDRGYSVPGILCSHPRSLPSANFMVLIFARKLLHGKIKVKDIICPARIEIRQLKFTYDVPDVVLVPSLPRLFRSGSRPWFTWCLWSLLKSLHNALNSMGDTAVHTDSGTRSRKLETASTELKAVRKFCELLTIVVPNSNCVIDHKWYECVQLNLSPGISLSTISEKAVLHLPENPACSKINSIFCNFCGP